MYGHVKQNAELSVADSFNIAPVTSLAVAIARKIRLRHEREIARRELISLSDRELADIGVSRADIESAVSCREGR
jgi:uncharacterized protein YjiS (DUF1127 family)